MRKLAIFGLALVAGVVTALVVGYFASEQPKTLHARVQWERVYRTPVGLIADADLIVEAKHVAAEPGRAAGEGEDATPFTNNTFAVESVLKGEFHDTDLVVEQTGGMMPDGVLMDVNDGGPFEPGESYLLFLKEQGNGMYFVINHQARYQINADVLQGVDPTDDVVAELHGQRLRTIREPIRGLVRLLQ